MKTAESKLLNAKVPSLLLSLALPMIVAQMVNALYNIVDRVYISYIPNIGTTALTGVGVCFPILMLISAFSALIGQGGAPLASIRLGAKNKEEAQKILGNCFVSLTVCALILTGVFMIFSQPILFAFGASNDTIGYASDYLHIYLLGTIFVQYALGLNPFINAQGKTKIGMATVTIGAILNLLLDPLFIFGLGMGVKGAALATVIAQGVSALWVLKFLTGKQTELRISKEYLRFDPRIFFLVVSLGISPFIMNSTDSLVSIAFNVQLKAMGGDLYVGSMVVLSSVMQLILMPLNGLNNGAQPIISYNYGAKAYDRVKEAVKTSFIINMSFTILMWAICVFAPQLLYNIFTPDEQLRALLGQVMPLYYAGIFMFGAQSAFQNAFLSLGQAKVSLVLALLRKVILLIPLIYIIPMLTQSGVNGVYCAEAIADVLAGTTTMICFIIIGKKLLNNQA
ncbi:MAG: MATE family efflux transporter [Erysipelotrichaceae bacterium]|nr:MATE family efflux transporter [Erysipelotrichaceae bacterium]MDY5252183.1 MATE family efflux transporter [Erysipelotrichaceae bacterium]